MADLYFINNEIPPYELSETKNACIKALAALQRPAKLTSQYAAELRHAVDILQQVLDHARTQPVKKYIPINTDPVFSVWLED